MIVLKNKVENKQAIIIGLLVIYVFVILSETIFFRKPTDGEHLQLELFWSYKVLNIEGKQMLANVLMFIPFGFLLSLLDKRICMVMLCGFLFSCSIEILQFVFKIGLCELDDVFHNTLGTLIGLLIGKWIIANYRKKN